MLRHISCVLLVVAVAACNDNDKTEQHNDIATTASPAQSAPPPPPSASAAPAPAVELELSSVGETMAFDKTTLTVPAKAKVHLVLKSNATSPLMPHNWVLVRAGAEAKVAADGLALGADKGYLPESDDVLTGTPLATPGKSTEITFTAPAAGSYPYICTVPGHYIMMKGTLVVTP